MLFERPKTASALLLLQLAACTESNVQDPPSDSGALDIGLMTFADAAIEMDAMEPDTGEVDAGEPDTGVPDLCPPMGPFGRRVGEQLAQATLTDCDGNPVELQGLCEKKASWMFHYAGW